MSQSRPLQETKEVPPSGGSLEIGNGNGEYKGIELPDLVPPSEGSLEIGNSNPPVRF